MVTLTQIVLDVMIIRFDYIYLFDLSHIQCVWAEYSEIWMKVGIQSFDKGFPLNYEKLFEDSYARVVGEGIALSDQGKYFFQTFYGIFFSKSDEICNKFAGVDMAAQVGVLQKSMVHIISFYVAKTDNEYLHSIAMTHSRDQYNIKPEYYDMWLEALIETVRKIDPEYEENIELAWRLAMTPGIQFMKFHYQR